MSAFWILNEHKITPDPIHVQVRRCSCGDVMGGEMVQLAVNQHLLEVAKRQRETMPSSQVTLDGLPR